MSDTFELIGQRALVTAVFANGIGKLLAALKANRHGQRDWLIGLLPWP
jgi:hypothetical protein